MNIGPLNSSPLAIARQPSYQYFVPHTLWTATLTVSLYLRRYLQVTRSPLNASLTFVSVYEKGTATLSAVLTLLTRVRHAIWLTVHGGGVWLMSYKKATAHLGSFLVSTGSYFSSKLSCVPRTNRHLTGTATMAAQLMDSSPNNIIYNIPSAPDDRTFSVDTGQRVFYMSLED